MFQPNAPMSQDDLGTWLKASAENKITARNAWQATLIEHFVDTERFTAAGGINFQRASSTLEGCMKVYSTRVDDVSDNTLKLLEIFNKDEEKKKSGTRKRHNFIEKNLANINLKERDSADFYDPVFSSILMKSDEYFLMDIVESRDKGMTVYGSGKRELVMEDEKIEISVEQLPICYSLKDFEAVITQHQTLEDEYVEEENMDAIDFDVENNENDDIGGNEDNKFIGEGIDVRTTDEISHENALNVFNETPFGYFKGWAGPTHWKVHLGTKARKETIKKPKQRIFLDFTIPVDQNMIENKSETVLSKQAILERRKNRNFLPEDYAYEVKDLYKFQMLDGYFGFQKMDIDRVKVGSSVEEHDVDDSTCLNTVDFDNNSTDNFAMDQQILIEKPTGQLGDLQLKFTRTPKRINIKQLKDRLSGLLGKDCCKFSQIVQLLPETYASKEAKDISPHFCLISLLHLANEMELDIKPTAGDLVVSKI